MPVHYELENNIAVVTVDNPPVNALSHDVRVGLIDAINRAQADDSQAVVILCSGKTFIAGADIKEFGKPAKTPTLPEVINAIEGSNKPVIAALHGTALGGGFELALGCHYRCATETASFGLPEVKLGLLPGAGGTQRLPRLVGVEAALDIIATGKRLNASQAADMGVIDRIIGAPMKDAALAYARELLQADKGVRRVSEIMMAANDLPSDFYSEYKHKLAKKMKGQEAPQRIVACVEAAATQSFEQGQKVERKLFMESLASPQSAALRHMFFAERTAPKVDGIPHDVAARPVESVGVIGGGTMGVGIAMSFANAGIPMQLLEISNEALEKGLALIAQNYERTLAKGKLTSAEVEQCRNRIQGTTDYAEFAQHDLVVEAVFESMEVKKQVFTRLDEVCKAGAILASNTSYLDLNEIAAATSRPQDVIGLHFFSPAHIMRLLEVVKGQETAQDVIVTAMNLGKKIGKVPVLANVCYGFIGNRMLRPYAREAQLCMIEGATPAQVDNALTTFGMAMGPLAVGDLAGIDIGYKARQALPEEERGDPRSYCIADALVESGRLGQKTGAGYYRYDPVTRAKSLDDAVMALIAEQAREHGVERRELSEDEIVDRHILALVNEGFNLLAEGIAQRASDIDVVYAAGYGFPS